MNIIRKNILSLFIIFSFVSYALYRNELNSTVSINTPVLLTDNKKSVTLPSVLPKKTNTNTTTITTKSSPKTTSTTPVIPTPAPVPTPPPVVLGKYRDGTYTGDIADAYYGDMQVSAVISGGFLTKINILASPDGRSTSVRINSRALPKLIQEAITAQSAKIDGISGASYSSPAFKETLASALSQAKN
jgi:uncharacterized protein with FMN-binding domain